MQNRLAITSHGTTAIRRRSGLELAREMKICKRGETDVEKGRGGKIPPYVLVVTTAGYSTPIAASPHLFDFEGHPPMLGADEVLTILRGVAAETAPPLWRSVDERIARRFPRLGPLARWVQQQYADDSRCRWYDSLHIAFAADFTLDLLDRGLGEETLLAGVLLHDIGYMAIPDKEVWNRPEVRVTHMQEGAAMAAEVLADLGFLPREIGHVVGLVATHDNPYLGYPLCGEPRLTLRDCDRVWVMHLASFYKDWACKPETDPNRSPQRLLAVRWAQFHGAAASPLAAAWGVDADVSLEATPRVEIPHLAFTRERVDRLFDRRRAELADPTMFGDRATFAARVRDAIHGE
jgi:hypothetical protein